MRRRAYNCLSNVAITQLVFLSTTSVSYILLAYVLHPLSVAYLMPPLVISLFSILSPCNQDTTDDVIAT